MTVSGGIVTQATKRLARILLACAVVSVGACGSDTAPVDRANTLIKGVNFVGISVSDLDQSIALYEAAADLEQMKVESALNTSLVGAIPNATGAAIQRSTLLRGANAQLWLMEFAHQETPPTQAVEVQGPGIAHVCYQVAKHTETYQQFLAAGGHPIGDQAMVQLNPRNPVEYAYLTDIDGAVVEVEHVDLSKLDPGTPVKNDYRIRHVSLATPDIDALVSFYEQLLEEPAPRRVGRLMKLSGEKVDRVSGLADSELEMAWFQVRNLELELIQYHSHPTTRPVSPRGLDALGYNMIVFDVGDLSMVKDLLIASGGSLIASTSGEGEIATVFGRDVDGNLLGFQQLDSDAAFSSQNFIDDGR